MARVTPEMIDAFFKEELHYGDDLHGLAYSAYKAGVAAYVFLEGHGSNKWKRQHGFNTTELNTTKQDLEFPDEFDWKQVHIQAAIAAMQGMLANPQTFEQIDHDEGFNEVCGGDKTKIVAIASVMYADALVAEMKRSDDVHAECRRMDAINTASVCENMTKIQNELQKKGGQDE